MRIAFSPPDIGDAEIEAVSEVLRSGWITTGPKTKAFEEALARYAGVSRAACFSSATAALECGLRLLGVGPGDEVITSAYTYTATASVIYHVGATPVLVDTAPGSYDMDYGQLGQAITPRTKVIIPIDIAGVMCDYDTLYTVLEQHAGLFKPRAGTCQEYYGRPIVLADAAHSFGASYHGSPSGSVADFTAFSFHAVKNLTTGEGGALVWRSSIGTGDDTRALLDDEAIYARLMNLSLHGQTKDALAKLMPGSWEYDIVEPAWKCNMTDIAAAIGLVQLERFPSLLDRRRELLGLYEEALVEVGMMASAEIPAKLDIIDHAPQTGASSCHLLLTRLIGKDQGFRDAMILALGKRGIACNVHYKPLPLLTAYRERGFHSADFPNALAQFSNELTLPLHTLLSNEDVRHIAENLAEVYDECEALGNKDVHHIAENLADVHAECERLGE